MYNRVKLKFKVIYEFIVVTLLTYDKYTFAPSTTLGEIIENVEREHTLESS